MNPLKSRLTTLLRSWPIRGGERRGASRAAIALAAVLAGLVGLGAAADKGKNTNNPKPEVQSRPLSKDDCKNGGWRNFTNPTFKNQGECVSHFANLQTQ